jgi:CRP-like cAMP-binding protein
MTKDQSPLTRRLDLLTKMTEQERNCLADLEHKSVRFDRGTEILCEGQMSDQTYIVQSGWGSCFKLLANGERQITAIVLPGDCINLRSPLRLEIHYTFQTVTDLTASRTKASRMVQVFDEFPHLGVALLLAAAQDDEMIVEHLISVGRRTAIERIAHLFLELHDRLWTVGFATETAFDCPLTQSDLADTLGLSAIHVNRMLRELRERGMMTFTEHRVELLDAGAMQELTGFTARTKDPILIRNTTPYLQ